MIQIDSKLIQNHTNWFKMILIWRFSRVCFLLPPLPSQLMKCIEQVFCWWKFFFFFLNDRRRSSSFHVSSSSSRWIEDACGSWCRFFALSFSDLNWRNVRLCCVPRPWGKEKKWKKGENIDSVSLEFASQMDSFCR